MNVPKFGNRMGGGGGGGTTNRSSSGAQRSSANENTCSASNDGCCWQLTRKSIEDDLFACCELKSIIRNENDSNEYASDQCFRVDRERQEKKEEKGRAWPSTATTQPQTHTHNQFCSRRNAVRLDRFIVATFDPPLQIISSNKNFIRLFSAIINHNFISIFILSAKT